MNMEYRPRRLMLRVIANGKNGSNQGPIKLFDERGGTIGRGTNNDWVLDDPLRFLSTSHAAVYFDQGNFHLVDTSTNGVLVNDDPLPLGNGRSAALKDGDVLHLGEYTLRVCLTADDAVPRSDIPLRGVSNAAAGAAPGTAAEAIDPLLLLNKAAAPVAPAPMSEAVSAIWKTDAAFVQAPHRPAAPLSGLPYSVDTLDPLALLGGAAITSDSGTQPRTHGSTSRPASQRDDAPMMASHFPPPAVPELPEDWFIDGAAASAAATDERVEGADTPQCSADIRACLAAFLRGAGVPDARGADPLQSFETAGRLLRDTLAGLSALREQLHAYAPNPSAHSAQSVNKQVFNHVE